MDRSSPLQLHRWVDRPLVGVAMLMAAAGFAQFGPAAALADVARHFGELGTGDSISEQAGLPGSVLGGGLAVVRLSGALALPLAATADRRGRRTTILGWVAIGLAMTVVAAASPGYWWFVAAFALARPMLTATDTVGEVLAAEHTPTAERAKALAFVAAAYGVGAGAVAVIRGLAGDLGFRAVFALAAVPLLLLPLIARFVTEPDRFRAREGVPPIPVLAAVGREHRAPLAVMAGVSFAAGFVTGPVSTLLFVYAENVLDVSSAFTAVLVVTAAVTGLAGLLVGRWGADRLGRRVTASASLVALAAAGIVAYGGSVAALVPGYLLGVLAGAAFGTPTLALANELFPTRIRSAVAGWLVLAGVLGATSGLLLAGVVADSSGDFAVAMAAVCLPAAVAAGLFGLVPETRGLELEESAPDLVP